MALDAGSSVAQERLPGSDILFVEQGWDEDERRLFYNEPQGSPILPLSWFLALERPDREGPFRDDALRP